SVFGYFAALCILSGLLFGLAPALRSSRVDLNSALKDGIRSVGTRRGGKLAGLLVIAQFALTLVLLTGAGIFARSFLENLSLNEWVPADRLMIASIRLAKGHYATPEARLHFFEQLLPRLRGRPAIHHRHQAIRGAILAESKRHRQAAALLHEGQARRLDAGDWRLRKPR